MNLTRGSTIGQPNKWSITVSTIFLTGLMWLRGIRLDELLVEPFIQVLWLLLVSISAFVSLNMRLSSSRTFFRNFRFSSLHSAIAQFSNTYSWSLCIFGTHIQWFDCYHGLSLNQRTLEWSCWPICSLFLGNRQVSYLFIVILNSYLFCSLVTHIWTS